jgi:ABC-2 type transport system permease protein
VSRSDPLLPNTLIIARREYLDRIRSRMFHASTVVLATLAVLVAFIPIFTKAVDRGTTTHMVVYSSDPQLSQTITANLGTFLNQQHAPGQVDPYALTSVSSQDAAVQTVEEGQADAALIGERGPNGRLEFRFYTGEGIAADRSQLISVGTFFIAILDYTSANRREPGQAFEFPSLETTAASGPRTGASPPDSSEFAGRRILGIVFVVLIFIILVIYGMWVAAGVVAEKTSRVMELIISAASARQLVIGKVLGIGASGVTQYVCVLVPALLALGLENRIATALFGEGDSISPSLVALAPPLLLAYGAYFVLGFALYALIYAAAGSLVSRPEDLQVMALPLSLLAIGGYLQAVLALSGGTAGFIRFASYVPFWSPFVMMTRLTVGRVEPWELLLSFGLLILTISVTVVVATRVYAAGVLLYGQRAGLRQVIEAVRHPA